jgi:hypothetical protein
MGKSGNRSGGGIEGRNVGHYRDPKQEPKAHAVSVGAVSRLGAKVGEGTPFKAFYNQQGYTTPIGPTDNMGQGPGANRMVMKSGSQSTTPAPRPMPRGKPEF